jgi:hypothetical protein
MYNEATFMKKKYVDTEEEGESDYDWTIQTLKDPKDTFFITRCHY